MSTAKVAPLEKNHTEVFLNEKSPSYNSLKLNDPIESKEDIVQNGALPLKEKSSEK